MFHILSPSFRLTPNPSYLHINGFIHRDIKAANLLIDDDGTVLLGDLGVAADLSEDSSHAPSNHSYKSYTVTAKSALSQAPPQAHPMSSSHSPSSNKRSSYASHTVPKPRIGKRKSFVGTVSAVLHRSFFLCYVYCLFPALLDGAGTHPGQAI